MDYALSEISNPFSTGAGGPIFELQVQSVFVLLLLTGGHVPPFENFPVSKVMLQARYAGFQTDDLVAIAGEGDRERKLLCQVKRGIRYTASNADCASSLAAAWADFHNDELFTRNRDAIAIISDQLSRVDLKSVLPIMEYARTASDPDEFYRKYTISKLVSNEARAKFKVFRDHIASANGGEPSREDTWEFLKHVYLISYDLDRLASTNRSLLHTILQSHSITDPVSALSRIFEVVAAFNQRAGTVTRSSLPPDLQELFAVKAKQKAPAAIAKKAPVDVTGWEDPQVIAKAMLLGSWSDQYSGDQHVAEKWLGSSAVVLKDVLQQPDAPISLQAGVWSTRDRLSVWENLGAYVFDDDLDQFEKIGINVLTEPDPKFSLPHESRFAARVVVGKQSYSDYIRKGIAETLALLGSRPEPLRNCSHNKPADVAAYVTRVVLQDAGWPVWASLDRLLPLLAEASPLTFLSAVEEALHSSARPFVELFEQERGGVGGGTYISGLLWALESLAWSQEYFMQAVMALGALANIDPGGTWSNRPASSLTTIFLPWHPQTAATAEKRLSALKNLNKEYPDAAWRLLISLLPGQTMSSSGSNAPTWRSWKPDDWEDGAINEEYDLLTSQYSELLIDDATHDPRRRVELIDHLDSLPNQALERALSMLESEPPEASEAIWNRLSSLVRKHKRYHDAEWVFPTEVIARLDALAQSLTPVDPQARYRALFPTYDRELFYQNHDWDEQTSQLDKQRIAAVEHLDALGGLAEIIEFAKSVDAPYRVGFAIGLAEHMSMGNQILPGLLSLDDGAEKQLALGFLYGKFKVEGWDWVDSLGHDSWSLEQVAQFYMGLPFTDHTWRRVERDLRNKQGLYWKSVEVNPYGKIESYHYAAVQLLKHKRPRDAIPCLYVAHFKKLEVDPQTLIDALLRSVDTDEPLHSMDTHEVLELIRLLQKREDTDLASLLRVEWAYLPLLDSLTGGNPVTLERSMASNPEVFLDVLKLIYKSEHDTEESKTPSEQQRIKAQGAFILLRNWKTPPGQQRGLEFSDSEFRSWLDRTIVLAEESGHLEIALLKVGCVLRYSPVADDGLPLRPAVAEVMNRPEMEAMREGYCNALIDSRGVHRIDPTGQDDIEIAERYELNASKLEDAGFVRIASSLKHLGQFYRRNAKQERDRAALRRRLYS